MLLLTLCAELVVHWAAVFSVYSRLLLLVIGTKINCCYEFWAGDLPPGCRFGLPFCFIVEAHRVGFPFLVVFLQLNRSFGAICGIEGFWTANAVESVG